MNGTLKLALVLSAYTCAACLGLAFVQNLTAPAIARVAEEEAFAAFRGFFPQADSFTDVAAEVPAPGGSVTFDRVFCAERNGETEGLLIQATGPTYKTSTLLSAFSPDGRMIRFQLSATTDTAGLGTKIGEPPFAGQFAGKTAADAFLVGEDIQAISGATISSRGAAEILRVSAEAAASYFDGGSR